MNLHKLFLQMLELSEDNAFQIEELLREIRDAKIDFKNVGVELSLEKFKEYYKRRHADSLANGSKYHIPLLKIIEGDNLDIIEDAAEKKGLI